MPQLPNRKILVAMSGGLDSSVAALLLKQAGAHVIGCFMHHPFHPQPDSALAHLHHLAQLLDIPLHVLDLSQPFDQLIDHFLREYNLGRTPNPCLRCNARIKFGHLLDFARSLGADFLATGHYARILHDPTAPQLLTALDLAKDQSYALFAIPRHRLAHLILPMGDLSKTQARNIAAQHNLPVLDRPESQEICFAPNHNYARLFHQRCPDALRPGPIRDTQGRLLGQHPGHQLFTIGQRRGLRIASTQPLYVLHKDATTNTLVVGTRRELLVHGLEADQTNWLIDPPLQPLHCTVKIRYKSPLTPATVWVEPPDRLRVRFDEPHPAVAPGQAVVCYAGPRVLGGGWILRTIP